MLTAAMGERRGGSIDMSDPTNPLNKLIRQNRKWSAQMKEEDPEFFNRLVNQQAPDYLWIGCSDSRVPANQIVGLQPGEVFVHRNVGNQAMHTDMNIMACLEYAVKSLKVKTIIVNGHYNCGAVAAALQLPTKTPGLVNCWISDIRSCRNQNAPELLSLEPVDQVKRLCELNVIRQVFHVCTSPVVANAWAEGQELVVYGTIYDVGDGLLRRLVGPINSSNGLTDGPEALLYNGRPIGQTNPSNGINISIPPSHNMDSSAGSNETMKGYAPSPSMLRSAVASLALMESIHQHSSWGKREPNGAATAEKKGEQGS